MVGIIGCIMFAGLVVINIKYSKSDKRFKDGFKPNTLTIKGYIIQIAWFIACGLLIVAVA
ncbi:MAG: hypothetical protein MK207_06530 [Saprospiraceae bacterium]|nr:hypothetical protein [Saprospiraceae bacterium]